MKVRHSEQRAVLTVKATKKKQPWGADNMKKITQASPWCRTLKDTYHRIQTNATGSIHKGNLGFTLKLRVDD